MHGPSQRAADDSTHRIMIIGDGQKNKNQKPSLNPCTAQCTAWCTARPNCYVPCLSALYYRQWERIIRFEDKLAAVEARMSAMFTSSWTTATRGV